MKSRSRRTLWGKIKAAFIGLAVIVLVGAVFLAVWRAGGWFINELLYENPTFALQVVEIQTDGVIPRKAIEKWSNLQRGQNLLRMDLSRIKRDLQLVPWIENVRVERALPRTLKITVKERDPVAQVRVVHSRRKPVVYLLDRDGRILLPLNAYLEGGEVGKGDGLPVISGLSYLKVRPGHDLTNPKALAALRLIEEFDRSPLANDEEIRWVTISAEQVLEVKTRSGAQVTFGLRDFPAQFVRWRQIAELGRSRNLELKSLNLSLSNNLPARWRTPENRPVSIPSA